MKKLAKFVRVLLEQATGIIVVRKESVVVSELVNGNTEVRIKDLILHPHLLVRFEETLQQYNGFICIKQQKGSRPNFGDVIITFTLPL